MIIPESPYLNSFVNGDELLAIPTPNLNQKIRRPSKLGRVGTGLLKTYRHEDLAWSAFQRRWDFEKELDS